MTIFRILESNRQQRIAVKKGFCWPAAIFGVFWALFKRFWPGALVILGVFVIVNTLAYVTERSGSTVLNFVSFLLLIAVSYLVGRYANIAFVAYLTNKGYRVVDEVKADSPEQALSAFDDKQ